MRSDATIGRSSIHISQIMPLAAERGYSALALTDRSLMIGVPSFLKECRRYGIKPLIGLEVMCLYEADHVPFVLLAKDDTGLQALMRLSSSLLSHEEYDPASEQTGTVDDILQAKDHCILIARSEGGAAHSALEMKDKEGIRAVYRRMKEVFGDFVIGISGCEKKAWRQSCDLLDEIADGLHIPCAAMPEVMYERKGEENLYTLVNAIRLKTDVNDAFMDLDAASWLESADELHAFYHENEIETAERIAAGCSISDAAPSVSLPVYYSDAKGHTSADYLKSLCRTGLSRRLEQNHIPLERQNAYRQRLSYELSVIIQMHFEDYFLIVFDYVRYAKKHDIWVGPGRGSAVASLTAYAIGITDIDPLAYHLLFERFLNTGRKGMPDIDVDFAEDGRKQVIAYVQQKYGKENTAGVVAVSCYKTKNLLGAVSRAMGIGGSADFRRLYKAVSDILKKRENSSMSLVELRPRIQNLLTPLSEPCYAACEKLAGIPAMYTRHPSGIVVADQPIVHAEPLMCLDENGPLTAFGQYEEGDLEERGLIKMDFLSLPSAKPLEEMVKQVRKKNPSFDLHHISYDDPLLYETFNRRLTLGYFQFDAWSMKNNILPAVHIENFNDLVVCNAIGRANLSQLVRQYGYLRSNPQRAVYFSRELYDILHETCGIMLYQEQVILTAHVCADYSMAQADELRRGIKKKDRKVLAANEHAFVSRCMAHPAHPYAQKEAESLWQDILRFADYGFNKSHSVAYTTIAMWQAYMKVHETDLYYACMVQYGNVRQSDADQEKQAILAMIRGKE